MGAKKMTFEYDKIPLEKRKKEVETIMEKNPNFVPIIIQPKPDSKLVLEDKYKFLVPETHTIGLLTLKIRNRMNLDPEQAIFLFINNSTLSMGHTIGDIYRKYKDEDGFLKIAVSEESVFG
jgi:hypothetical protein